MYSRVPSGHRVPGDTHIPDTTQDPTHFTLMSEQNLECGEVMNEEEEYLNITTCTLPYADDLLDKVKDNFCVIIMIDHEEKLTDFCSAKNPDPHYEELEPRP